MKVAYQVYGSITPAPKVQPVTNVSELRSISVTPVFSRITERLVMRDFFYQFLSFLIVESLCLVFTLLCYATFAIYV